MDNNDNIKASADARIVRTVRRLKSTKNITNSTIKENSKINGTIKLGTTKSSKDIISSNISSKSSSSKNIFSSLKNVKSILGNDKRMSINSYIRKQTGLNENNNHQPYDYYNLRRVMKTRSEYQKNILSEANLKKYKTECVNLIKSDSELKGMFNKIGINKEEGYNTYIMENFFNKEYFLFQLEILILNDIQENNTLKVFSIRKKRLPFKEVKEKFYKNEIKRKLNKKIAEMNYIERIQSIEEKIDNHINNLMKFDL